MRLAMNFRREIAELAARARTAPAGSPCSAPSRCARSSRRRFGLPKQFGQIDIDKQREILADKTGALFGKSTLDAFKDPAAVEKVITRFLARAQIEGGITATTPGAGALTLLQSMTAASSQGLLNLLASRR